jgi:V-type H+-transporting ATPase subunit C
MQPTQYLLVSLPLRIFDDDPMTALAATVGRDNGETLPFPIPSFKIGTLDALVQHADDLAKLNAACEAAAAKVADSLKGILDGDEDKATQQKMVNDSRLRAPNTSPPGLLACLTGVRRAHGSLPSYLPVE